MLLAAHPNWPIPDLHWAAFAVAAFAVAAAAAAAAAAPAAQVAAARTAAAQVAAAETAGELQEIYPSTDQAAGRLQVCPPRWSAAAVVIQRSCQRKELHDCFVEGHWYSGCCYHPGPHKPDWLPMPRKA
eukprot:925187-Pelagomonas_calceolata.AAC.3